MARPDREVPEGYELVAVQASQNWRLSEGRTCRHGAGSVIGRRACGRPAVAEINRGRVRPQWWAYCEDHLCGRWIEDGKVMNWILKAISDPPGSTR